MKAPVRKGCEELPTTVSPNVGELKTEKGFWSGKTIYWNPGSSIVVLKSDLMPRHFADLARNLYLDNLSAGISERLDHCRKQQILPLCDFMRESKTFRNTFTPSRLSAFDGQEFIGPFKKKRWLPISEWLKSNLKTDAERETYLIEVMRDSMINGRGVLNNVHRLNVSFLHFGMPDFAKALESFQTVEAMLCALGTIRQFSWNYFKHDFNWAHQNNRQCIRVYKDLDFPFAKMLTPEDAQWALGFSNAANLFLVSCVREGFVLLPSHYTNLVSSCRLIHPTWNWDAVPPLATQLLQSVLCSTSVKNIEDLPNNPHEWLNGIKAKSNMQRVFMPQIELHQRLNPSLPRWPLANLNRSKQLAISRTAKDDADLLEAEYGEVWAEFCRVYEMASEVGPTDRRIALRAILPWVKLRGFRSPEQVMPRDLHDPLRPSNSESFKAHLEINSNFATAGETRSLGPTWNAAARAFLLVSNHLKISPSEKMKGFSNPFEPHEMPFEKGKRSKTKRKRLPTDIHEAIIEILMDADESGKPTYRWAMSAFPDTFDWFNPASGTLERVQCPSRCAALSLLLCLPFRGKQVQWLDRGLMDSMRWNQNVSAMVVNEHPLRNFRYSDGRTQEELYGRPSGVLQVMGDEIGAEGGTVGIFVNTNKTAMWNPENKRGYEVPWPMPALDPANKPNVGSWISRPYQIIWAQNSWIEKYLPMPTPVSFVDSASERGKIHERYLSSIPSFCPLFADLSERSYKHGDALTHIYLPVSKAKLTRLFNSICVEVERRYAEEGKIISITRPDSSDTAYQGRSAIFDIHALRVSGISRLIELGIPVAIVQEFIVGHATAVMTLYYNKVLTATARQEIMAGLQADVGDWKYRKEELSKRAELWSFNVRWAKYRPADQMADFASWKSVPGGICPVGGLGCEEGGILDDDAASGKETFVPVVGGCGNCRFFSTGPAFLIHQSQALNEIMLELRLHGKQRATLIEKRSELSWSDTPELGQRQRELLARQIAELSEAVADIDVKLEPLVLEWINRLRMFEDSKAKIAVWRENSPQESTNRATSLEHLYADKLPVEIDIRLEKAGEFSLVQNILEGAVARGGLHHASSLSKERCAAFMDRVLRSGGSRRLLIDIQDEKTRYVVAHKFANVASSIFGSASIDDHLASGAPLHSSREDKEAFIEWASTLLCSQDSASISTKRLNSSGEVKH
ncbi:VPA1269 family protein [Paucibacter sp. AS339]|uniref:VPA1269 family protein n=1 Tax=Paucibacter hankyongi TaxID=3133434 RepID=UPI0030AB9A28